MIKGLKIFLGILLAANVVLAGNFALGADGAEGKFFPMELSYPNIPGLGRLSDYQNLEASKQVGFVVGYIFKLVFFISIGAGLMALLASGVLYIASLSKPRWLILAKQMARNAMLGLFILLIAGLLLYAINPELLSLTLNKPGLVNISFSTGDSGAPNTITLEQAPFKKELTGAVDSLSEKVYINSKGQYYEELGAKGWCLTNGYGGAVTSQGDLIAGLPDEDAYKEIKEKGCEKPSTSSGDKYIYKAEIQIRETADIVGEAAVLVKDLEGLFAQCRCGDANWYVKWDLGNATKPECVPGLMPDDPKYIAAKQSGNECSIQCKSCGQDSKSAAGSQSKFLTCDLRDVRKIKNSSGVYVYQACTRGGGVGTCNPDMVIGPNPNDIQVDPCWISFSSPANTASSILIGPACKSGASVDSISTANLIKWKTLQILELQTKLEAKTRISANFLDSIILMGRALDVNKIGDIVGGAYGKWTYDIASDVEKWNKEGKKVILLDYKSAQEQTQDLGTGGSSEAGFNTPQGKGILARIKSFLAPFVSAFEPGFDFEPATLFYIVSDTSGGTSKEVLENNQATSLRGQRYNLFSVLTNLSLEKIGAIFKECLVSAFGEADYILDKDQIQSVIDAAVNGGAIDHLKEVIRQQLDAMAQATLDGGQEVIGNDASLQYIKKFYDKCHVDCTGKSLEDVSKELKGNECSDNRASALANTCCYCIRNLMDNGIPPRFVSDTVARLFTYNAGDALPKIKKTLETKTMDVLFPPDGTIGTFLNSDMATVYDSILKGALTKPFDEQVPALGTLLDKPVEKVLPGFIKDVNNFFLNSVSSTRYYIKKYQEGFFQSLANQFIEQPIHQWADNWFDARGLGTKNLTINGCYEERKNGYIYEVGDIVSYNAAVREWKAGGKKDLEPREPGRCVKMTVGVINSLGPNRGVPKRFIYRSADNTSLGPEEIDRVEEDMTLSSSEVGTICETAGYSWRATYSIRNTTRENQYDLIPKMPEIEDTQYSCYESSDLAQDVKGAVETVRDAEKMRNYVGGGLVNYAEKLGVALTQTALQFALAYARVYVEDNIIGPMISSWNTVTGFQEGMNKFLTSSVKEALPSQISNFLQSNIQAELERFCRNYKSAKNSQEFCSNPSNANENTWVNVPGLAVSLPEGVTWQDEGAVKGSICVSQATGDKICQLEEHLDSKVIEEITYYACEQRYSTDSKWQEVCRGIFNSLKEPLGEVLNNICYTQNKGTANEKKTCMEINKWFGQSIAKAFFPEISNIDDIVKSTPKDVFCGKYITSSGGNIIFPASQNFVASQCQAAFSNKFGFIPTITNDQAKIAPVKNIMPWCAFINYGCSNPLTLPGSDPNLTVGKFVKAAVNMSCSALDSQVGAGQCFCKYDCPKGENILSDTTKKDACKFCSTMARNSVFYSLLYKAVENEPTMPRSGSRESEMDFYAQMYNDFPELELDIKAVASNRGLTDWAAIKALNPDPSEILASISSNNLKNILKIAVEVGRDGTRIGQASIKSVLGQDEFLGRSPYAVLTEKICPEIISNFESQNHDYTFDSVREGGFDAIRSSLPYTIESASSFTTADQIRIISTVPNSENYILCKVLDRKFKEIFGLDQPLRNYIQPKEYIILFDLLQDKLSEGNREDCQRGENFFYENGQAMCCDPTLGIGRGLCYKVGERPAGLNQTLDFMSFNDPIEGLRVLQQDMPEQGAYLYTFPFYKSGNSCLNPGTKASSCSSPIPNILEGRGININAVIAAPTESIDIYEGELVPVSKILGSVPGKDAKGNATNYYFVKPVDTEDLILVFEKPNQAKAEFAEVLNFMETRLGDLLKSGMGNQTILDYLCHAITSEITYNGPFDVNNTICDINISSQMDDFDAVREKIVEILAKPPTDLMEKYLTRKFSISGLLNKEGRASVMDVISANTALGQPIIDTIFRGLGLEQVFYDVAEASEKKSKWLDAMAMKGVGAIQDGLEKVLVEWPKQAGQAIAGLFGFEVGDKTSAEVAGACYDKPGAMGNNDCKPGEVVKNPGDKAQCCILAKAQACTPRCRAVSYGTKQCNVLLGEVPEVEIGPNGTLMCCLDLLPNRENPTQCQRCRVVNFEAGGKCRKADENGQGGENKIGNTCCSVEEYRESLNVPATEESEDIENGGYCCTTVGQCISNRLSSHLENLAEMMADGEVPLESLKEK